MALSNGGAAHSVVAGEYEIASNAFLGASDSYGLILPANKQTQLLRNAVGVALSCLAQAEALGVHSEDELNGADT